MRTTTARRVVRTVGALVLLGSLSACGGQEGSGAVGPSLGHSASGSVVDGYYTAEGAPDPVACESDDQCVASGVLREDGCCWTYRDANLVPQSAAYREWTNERRSECDVEACGPPPVPTQPADCLFEVSCQQGRCENACP